MNIVVQSGAACAASAAAILPPAPGLSSTTTGWPSAAASPSAITRDCTSALPPAGKGTMRLGGWLGQSWARAAAASEPAAKTMVRQNARRDEKRCMVVLLTRMQIRCHFSPGETRTGADKQKRRRIKCRAGYQKSAKFQYVREILQK